MLKILSEKTKHDLNENAIIWAVASTTDTFNSSKIYSPFSLWFVPISFWDCRSCTQQKEEEEMTK
jgi:hypothetical protein